MHSLYLDRLRHSRDCLANAAGPRANVLVSGVAGALFVAWSVTACSVLPQDYWTWNQRGVSSDVAEVRLEHSTDGYITHMKVYSLNGVTIIEGATRRTAESCSDCSARIDVIVMGADGHVVDEVEVPVGQRVHHDAVEWFSAELPYEMNPGMVLVVRYHYDVSHSRPKDADPL